VKKFLATTALVLAATTAQAATITAKRDGCTPKDCYAINISGEIKPQDFMTFEALVKKNDIKVAAVYLDSDGGALVSGLIIGLMVHKFGFATVVDHDAFCISACASIWIAGAKRYVAPTAKIGFHQPWFKDKRGHMHVDPRAIALMKEYYAKVGVPKPAADFFVAADPKDVYWMNSDLAAGFKIETTELEAKEEPKQAAPKSEVGTATLPKDFIDQLTSKKPL
jgi:hypothetical protein